MRSLHTNILCVLVVLTIDSVASCQTYSCVDVVNPSNAPLCNTTYLQILLPAKICAINPISPLSADFTYFCTQSGFDTWRDACPKKNYDLEGFCGGDSNFFNTSCNMIPCTTDLDCPKPAEPIAALLPCYDCCFMCHDESTCNVFVAQGIYAPRGNTTCASCSSTFDPTEPPVATTPVSPPVDQLMSRIRFFNAQPGARTHLQLATDFSSFGIVPGLDAWSNSGVLEKSDYMALPNPFIPLNQPTGFYLYDRLNGQALTSARNATLVGSQSYTFIAVGPSDNSTNNFTMPYVMFGVTEKPTNPALYSGQALVKVVNAVASSYGSNILVTISEGITILYTQISFGASTFFMPFKRQVDINVYLDDQTLLIRNLYLQTDATTMVYLQGDSDAGYRWSSTVVPLSLFDTPIEPPVSNTPIAPPVSNTPISPAQCLHGFVESTGYCNCYSGFTNSNLSIPYECAILPPYECRPLPAPLPLENYQVPFLGALYASRNYLNAAVFSDFVAGRRTWIEFPDPECNLINSPSFYTKRTNACMDEFDASIPFMNCGFAKTSYADQDIYRGEMRVKHIDQLQVDGTNIERIIDTPFSLAISLPKNILIQSNVTIVGSPSNNFTVNAALIEQTVNLATQTGRLTFITSVPAPLTVIGVILQSAPYNVGATVNFIPTNCSQTGYCQQKFSIDLDIRNCDISGTYNLALEVACASPQNCPIVYNTIVSVDVTAIITAQPTCGTAYVDIGLHGSLQAFSDPAFTNPALSFTSNQPAYFLVDTSAEVDITRVTLNGVFYNGPNVPGYALLTNDSISSLGLRNNFAYGRRSSSQVWFSLDVTVSSPDSNSTTLFKLNNGENGVYNFYALVDIEWTEGGAGSNNSTSPFKKRMTLAGKVLNQGSQFTSQVQINGSAQSPKEDNAVSSTSVTVVSLFSLLVAATISLLF